MHRFLIFTISMSLLVLFLGAQLSAQSKVKLQGKWNCVVPASDIIEAGSDYSGAYESLDNEVQFSVNDKNKVEQNGYGWSVSIRRSDILWDNTAKIYVRRTSNGTPHDSGNIPTTITGGTSYQQVTETETFFFSGYRGSEDIDIQYKLQGVSVVIEAQKYTTYIIYTVSSL